MYSVYDFETLHLCIEDVYDVEYSCIYRIIVLSAICNSHSYRQESSRQTQGDNSSVHQTVRISRVSHQAT